METTETALNSALVQILKFTTSYLQSIYMVTLFELEKVQEFRFITAALIQPGTMVYHSFQVPTTAELITMTST
jgi:hypothetical protein